jgi:hypothetical protein
MSRNFCPRRLDLRTIDGSPAFFEGGHAVRARDIECPAVSFRLNLLSEIPPNASAV